MAGKLTPAFFIMATDKNDTELYFEWWLEELKSKGLVISYEREPETFVIHDAIPIFYDQNSKTTSITKSFSLLPTLIYTPDYEVVFHSSMINKLIGEVDKLNNILVPNGFEGIGSAYQETLFYTTQKNDNGYLKVYFDAKAPSSASKVNARLSSTRDFKYIARAMYERYGIIVNKVVPVGMKTSLFGKTFMPARYRFTDKSGSPRKLKDYEAGFKKLSEYLKIKDINL